MASYTLEDGRSTCAEDETDLFEGTRFGVRVGIANNLVRTSACMTIADQGRHQKGGTHQFQSVCSNGKKSHKSVLPQYDFLDSAGFMMNIFSRTHGSSGL